MAGPDRSRALSCVISICAFAAGAMIAGALLVRRGRDAGWNEDLRSGIGLELPFAIAFALLNAFSPPAASWIKPVLIGTAACGLGIQSVAVRRLKISGVVTTFITGTITAAVVSLVAKNRSPARPLERGSPSLLAAMFGCYVLAAAAGAGLAHVSQGLAASIPPSAIAVAGFRAWRR
jgi:uncharacterized membrane protein YoaK (UPF0700 family)